MIPSPARLPADLRLLPIAGLTVAVPAAIAYAFAGLWLPHAVALLVAMGLALLLGGALHERGLSGFCDVLALRSPLETPLSAAGAAGLVLVLLARLEVLSSIDPSWIAVCLVTAAAFSRGCAAFALGGTMATPRLADTPSTPAAPGTRGAVAFGLGLLPAAAAAVWTGNFEVFGTAAGLALATTAVVRRTLVRRRLPRDARALGALQQLSELGFLIGILATLSIDDETLADPSS